MDWKSLGKKLLASFDWKGALASVYKSDLRPYLAKKVLDSTSKWDDVAFGLVDQLLTKLVDEQLLANEKSVSEMIELAKHA